VNVSEKRRLWYVNCICPPITNAIKAMKTHMIIIAALLFMGGLSAQGRNKNKETKEEKAVRIESEYQSMARLIDNKQFILEADFRSNQYGYRVSVSSMINFIKVDSAIAVIQTGSNYRVGVNGVGGLTAEGKISKWEVVKDSKRKSFVIRMNVSTALGFYDIFINVSVQGNASATISGSTSGKLIYSGRLLSLPESRVYQGSTI
jgi:Domain of unknown function (DUF4251)